MPIELGLIALISDITADFLESNPPDLLPAAMLIAAYIGSLFIAVAGRYHMTMGLIKLVKLTINLIESKLCK